MKSTPLISVLMPCFNSEKYIKEAIDSILNQTYSNLELIIVNDGSNDSSEEVILSYSDPRLKYIKNENNQKIVKTLNRGLNVAKGDYIARMDSDDISTLDRLEVQLNFMQNNENVDVCGMWMKTVGSEHSTIFKYPEINSDIRLKMLFSSAIAHPTIMARRGFYEQFRYEELYDKCEDYHLWASSIKSKTFYNIPRVGVYYRTHESQTTKNLGIHAEKKHLAQQRVFEQIFDIEVDEYRLNSLELSKELFSCDYLEKVNSVRGVFDERKLRKEILIHLSKHYPLEKEGNFKTLLLSKYYMAIVLKIKNKIVVSSYR